MTGETIGGQKDFPTDLTHVAWFLDRVSFITRFFIPVLIHTGSQLSYLSLVCGETPQKKLWRQWQRLFHGSNPPLMRKLVRIALYRGIHVFFFFFHSFLCITAAEDVSSRQILEGYVHTLSDHATKCFDLQQKLYPGPAPFHPSSVCFASFVALYCMKT